MTNRMIDYFGLCSGNPEPTPEEREVVRKLIERFREIAVEHGLRIEIATAPDLPARAPIDKVALGKSVAALLGGKEVNLGSNPKHDVMRPDGIEGSGNRDSTTK